MLTAIVAHPYILNGIFVSKEQWVCLAVLLWLTKINTEIAKVDALLHWSISTAVLAGTYDAWGMNRPP